MSMILLVALVDIVQSESASIPFTSSFSFSSSSWLEGRMILVRGGEDKVGENKSHQNEEIEGHEQETAATPATRSTNDDIEILEEKTVYKNWRTIIQRTVRLRNGKIANFDVRISSTLHCAPNTIPCQDQSLRHEITHNRDTVPQNYQPPCFVELTFFWSVS
jgi:hypothetical protein